MIHMQGKKMDKRIAYERAQILDIKKVLNQFLKNIKHRLNKINKRYHVSQKGNINRYEQ